MNRVSNDMFRKDIPLSLWDEAKRLYSIGKRGYHSFEHALDVLTRVDMLNKDVGFFNYEAARLAALYHDAVYVPGAKDNELMSCVALQEALKKTEEKYEAAVFGEALNLIRATEDHTQPIDRYQEWDTVLFMDCDMLGFADPYDVFCYRNDQIAEEYEQVYTPKEYAKGRILFLRDLYLKGVFRSPYCRKKFEPYAKANILEHLQELGALRRGDEQEV